MMNRLLRIWTLTLDLVMLVLLLAAPVPARTAERPLRRPERQQYKLERTLDGEFMSPAPAFARVEERRAVR